MWGIGFVDVVVQTHPFHRTAASEGVLMLPGGGSRGGGSRASVQPHVSSVLGRLEPSTKPSTNNTNSNNAVPTRVPTFMYVPTRGPRAPENVVSQSLFMVYSRWQPSALDSQVPHTRPLTRRNINIQYVSPTHPCGPFCTSPGEKRLLSNLVRSNIQDLTPYRCARDDYSQGVLLDANENSFGPALVATQVAKRRGK